MSYLLRLLDCSLALSGWEEAGQAAREQLSEAILLSILLDNTSFWGLLGANGSAGILRAVGRYLGWEHRASAKRELLSCFSAVFWDLLQDSEGVPALEILVQEYLQMPEESFQGLLLAAGPEAVRRFLALLHRSWHRLRGEGMPSPTSREETLQSLAVLLLRRLPRLTPELFVSLLQFIPFMAVSDIARLPPALLANESVLAALQTQSSRLTRGQKSAFARCLLQAPFLGAVLTWPLGFLRDILPLLPHLPLHCFLQFTPQQVGRKPRGPRAGGGPSPTPCELAPLCHWPCPQWVGVPAPQTKSRLWPVRIWGLGDDWQPLQLGLVQGCHVAGSLANSSRAAGPKPGRRLGSLACFLSPEELQDLAWLRDPWAAVEQNLLACGAAGTLRQHGRVMLSLADLLCSTSLATVSPGELPAWRGILPEMGVGFLGRLSAAQLNALLPHLRLTQLTCALGSLVVGMSCAALQELGWEDFLGALRTLCVEPRSLLPSLVLGAAGPGMRGHGATPSAPTAPFPCGGKALPADLQPLSWGPSPSLCLQGAREPQAWSRIGWQEPLAGTAALLAPPALGPSRPWGQPWCQPLPGAWAPMRREGVGRMGPSAPFIPGQGSPSPCSARLCSGSRRAKLVEMLPDAMMRLVLDHTTRQPRSLLALPATRRAVLARGALRSLWLLAGTELTGEDLDRLGPLVGFLGRESTARVRPESLLPRLGDLQDTCLAAEAAAELGRLLLSERALGACATSPGEHRVLSRCRHTALWPATPRPLCPVLELCHPHQCPVLELCHPHQCPVLVAGLGQGTTVSPCTALPSPDPSPAALVPGALPCPAHTLSVPAAWCPHAVPPRLVCPPRAPHCGRCGGTWGCGQPAQAGTAAAVPSCAAVRATFPVAWSMAQLAAMAPPQLGGCLGLLSQDPALHPDQLRAALGQAHRVRGGMDRAGEGHGGLCWGGCWGSAELCWSWGGGAGCGELWWHGGGNVPGGLWWPWEAACGGLCWPWGAVPWGARCWQHWAGGCWQLVVLLVPQLWGSARALEPAQTLRLGRLATQLGELELRELLLPDWGALSALGELDDWSPEQMRAVVSAFVRQRGVSARDLGLPELVALGHLLCGLPAAELGGLDSRELSKAAPFPGWLSLRGTEQQAEELAACLTSSAAFGPAAAWGPEIFAEVGTLAGEVWDRAMPCGHCRLLWWSLCPGTAPRPCAVPRLGSLTSLSALVPEQLWALMPRAITAVPPPKFAVSSRQLPLARSARARVAPSPRIQGRGDPWPGQCGGSPPLTGCRGMEVEPILAVHTCVYRQERSQAPVWLHLGSPSLPAPLLSVSIPVINL
ncbi:LOW QUALITY PROTEIN: stereocilin [Tyto alba]|uniref:LOW QUALITY PROTEIN: stereocilin n=1 Tax=Tyto alba TaxID=56313 RepID=UPI001C67B49F|nr:LOW QUALITY PROTEIN: stereocilin [Tyto alba]